MGLIFKQNFFFFTKNAFFGCFWAFVGQPHGHIHWATSMPFASFNPTNPRTHLRNFREIFLSFGDFENLSFFESAIFFLFIHMKISRNLYGRMDGSKFWCFPWFTENSLLCLILRYTVYIYLQKWKKMPLDLPQAVFIFCQIAKR